MTKLMDTEFILLYWDRNMKDFGKMIYSMVTVMKPGQMVQFIRVNMKTVKKMGSIIFSLFLKFRKIHMA